MCIAILKPKGKSLDKNLLMTCSENNPDGCGFAYLDDNSGDIIINKFMLFEDFWKEYSKIQKNHTTLVHFRIATHGKVELQNCHPFKLNSKMVLIHNGIISGYGSRIDNVSDTKDFIEKVIGNISHKMWKNPSFRELVGKAIGYSKFAILDTNDNYYIINEDKGLWDNGVWFSNDSYKKRVAKIVSSTSKTTTSQSTWAYLMRCPKCGEEYAVTNWHKNVCKKCLNQLEQVGWVHNGKKNYNSNYCSNYKKINNTVYINGLYV